MARNIYFSDAVRSEQRLYESIIIESLKMYGQDLYYLPRTIVNENTIFGEDVPSQFNNSYKIEMYIENTEGFDGEGDLFTKFGVEIRDEATFIVSRKRWNNTVGQANNEIEGERPREGDIIYIPLSNSMFEVMHVEHEQPFYQLANLPVFKMRCQLFEYSGEDLDTGVDVIDGIEVDSNYTFEFYLYDTSGDNWNYEDNFSFTVYLECDSTNVTCDSDEYFESWSYNTNDTNGNLIANKL